MSDHLRDRLAPMRVGILFILLTFAYGFGLGGVFGAFEDSIKGSLKADAKAVFDTVYKGDEAKMNKITSKSWTYWKRAHLHAGGMGAAAMGMALLLSFCCAGDRYRMIAALFLGLGGLGYSMFWMFAGIKAPGMGSTGAAKESLEFLAIPTSSMFIIGLLMVLVCWVKTMFLSTPSAPPAS